MSATFTRDEVARLYGVSPRVARGMFTDRGGHLPRLHGRVLRTPANTVLEELRLTRGEALALLNPPTESEAA